MTTLTLTQAARRNIEETGCDPVADLAEIKRCHTTREEFLQFCLNGADADRVQGWRDYVDALFAEIVTYRVYRFDSETDGSQQTMLAEFATQDAAIEYARRNGGHQIQDSNDGEVLNLAPEAS